MIGSQNLSVAFFHGIVKYSLKGKSPPKMENCHHMTFFFLLNSKEDHLNNVDNQIIRFPFTSIVFFIHTVKVNGKQNCLVTNILKYIYCVLQKKRKNSYMRVSI